MSILSDAPLIFDALVDGIKYDQSARRYRYQGENKPGEPITGSFVSRDAVLKLQSSYLEKLKTELVSISPRISRGEIGSYKDAATILKKIHVSEGVIAAQGIDRLTNKDLGKIGQILKNQYYQGKDRETGKSFGLKHLFKEVASGSVSEAQLSNRLSMYAESGRITRGVILQGRAIESGYTESMRIDSGDDAECADCSEYAAAGWRPIGELPTPGVDCQCRTRCRCRLIFKLLPLVFYLGLALTTMPIYS
jgi:hypothetical protein